MTTIFGILSLLGALLGLAVFAWCLFGKIADAPEGASSVPSTKGHEGATTLMPHQVHRFAPGETTSGQCSQNPWDWNDTPSGPACPFCGVPFHTSGPVCWC